MKQSQGLKEIMLGGAAVLMAIQPAFAAPSAEITAVQLNPTKSGVNVLLQTKPGERPHVFAVNRSDSWTADITGTQLRLPNGKSFTKENPAPGISRITVAQLDKDSVRVTAIGQNGGLLGDVLRPDAGGVLLSLSPSTGQRTARAVPATLPSVPSNLQRATTPARSLPPLAQAAPPPPRPATPPPVTTPPPPGPALRSPTPPLVPNPNITIQGGSPGATNPVALPALPRALPPPTGDIAISQFNPATSTIDLGTAERVPRLVLRDAPAREVLALLARAAGLNLAYAPPKVTGPGQQQQQQQPGAPADEGPRVTLDVENESVQDVFNNILQITGLEANRVGRTVIVGPRLPDDARNVATRTLRLNQASATEAANYLVSQGAEFQLPITRVTIVPIGTPGPNQILTRIEEPDIKLIRAQRGDAPLPLSGLAVSVDARLNSVVVSGIPRKVEVASALLAQLDARRRQVAVNVKVIDINLSNAERVGFSFSFGVGQNRFINQGGLGIFNFGTSSPATVAAPDPTQIGTTPFTNPANIPSREFNFASNFFAQLQLAVDTGNAKILTDPTLVVQEGQTARVDLTQEVVTNIEVETTGSGDSATVTVTTEKGKAGVTLEIVVDRIDDNGFIQLAVNPVVSVPASLFNITIPGFGGSPASSQQITLLQSRSLQSGRIRLRDGQTLVASGIIQDSDRATVRKIPILGDIPILGAFFRRTERVNERREVVIVLTPRILDDSDRSTFGYSYTPGPGVRQVLEAQPVPVRPVPVRPAP